RSGALTLALSFKAGSRADSPSCSLRQRRMNHLERYIGVACDLKSSRNGSIVADATQISFRAFYPALKDRAKLRLPLRGSNLSHARRQPAFPISIHPATQRRPNKTGRSSASVSTSRLWLPATPRPAADYHGAFPGRTASSTLPSPRHLLSTNSPPPAARPRT